MNLTLNTIRTGSVGNSYLLTCGDHSIILDVGVNYKEILKACHYDLVSIDGILVTHVHGDHAGGIKYWLTMGIPVFSNAEVCKAYAGVECIKPKFVRRFGQRRWAVIPFNLPHDGVENYGWLIRCPNGEKLLYATDYAYIKETFTKYGVEHFLLECNFMDYSDIEGESGKGEHVLHGHAPLSVVEGFLAVNCTEATKSITLCHLSRENAIPEAIREHITAITPEGVAVNIATRGETLVLSKEDTE